MAFLVLAFIAFLSTLSLIHASTQLVPCTGNDDQLKFYHDYTEPQCPGRFHLKGKDCEETDPINPLHYDPTQINLNAPEIKNCAFCDSYCQIKTSYTYGTEQPVDTQPLCRGPVHCEISGNEIVSYSWHEKPVGPDGWKAHVVDIALGDGYKPPFSGDTQRSAIGRRVDLLQNECAYWTFIPFLRNSCGTYTRRDTIYHKHSHFPERCENPRSTPNFCISQPVEQTPTDVKKQRPRSLDGKYWLVKVDCYTGQKLLSSLEDDMLSRPDVALADDSVYMKTLAKFWKDSAPFEWKTAHGTICDWSAGLGPWPVPADCLDAIDSLRMSAEEVFSSYDLTTVARYGACVVHVQINDKANIPDCQFSYLEIAIAADRGRRDCDRPFANCPAYPLYDKGDSCNGWVTFTADADDDCWA